MLSGYPSARLPVRPSARLPVCLPACLPVCMSAPASAAAAASQEGVDYTRQSDSATSSQVLRQAQLLCWFRINGGATIGGAVIVI
eukprot:7454030-Heterocapsa_arctica.AAC.1